MPITFLDGVRVLDLSQYLPGPFATRMLSDMGADVVKVEPPGGEPGRKLAADGTVTVSPYWHIINAGKRVVEMNLKATDEHDAFERMIAAADVLLESYRPGVMERLGFGEARLKELNPNLVHCALSGYGQTGPLRLATGHDLNYEALSGSLESTGTLEAPVIPFPPMADHAGAMQAVIAILGALFAQRHGGGGAFLDVSLAESLLALQELAFAFDTRRGMGLLTGGSACYHIYRTSDGYHVTLSPLEPKFWANFCEAVGHPEWTARQWEPFPQTDLIAQVAELFASKPRAHWDALLPNAECCYLAVVNHAELATHPHVADRGFIHKHPDYTEVLFPAYVNGEPPMARSEVRLCPVDEILAGWTKA